MCVASGTDVAIAHRMMVDWVGAGGTTSSTECCGTTTDDNHAVHAGPGSGTMKGNLLCSTAEIIRKYAKESAFTREAVSFAETFKSVNQAAPRATLQSERISSIGELFEQADQLNKLVQQKFFAIAAKHGARFAPIQVKREDRAIQKSIRGYGGVWLRLNDLVRTSIVFRDLKSLHACYKDISTDPDVQIMRSRPDKNRFDPDFDGIPILLSMDIFICSTMREIYLYILPALVSSSVFPLLFPPRCWFVFVFVVGCLCLS